MLFRSDRFDAPQPSPPPALDGFDLAALKNADNITAAVTKLIDDTKASIERQFELARTRANANPHLFETAFAAADIFQMQLARARAKSDPSDILIKPDMRDAMPTAFDRADEFIAEGYSAMMANRTALEKKLTA